MRDVFVAGTGTIRFGRYPELLLEDFALDAVTEAVDDAGVAGRDLNVAVFGNSNGGRVAGQRVLRELGMTGMPILNVENACAGGGTAMHVGWMAVASGLHDLALVVGMEKMQKGLIPPNPGEYEAFLGKTLPAKYALRARKHMDQYGLTEEQLAQVSVKNHHAGALNPNAHYQEEVTLEQVLGSRPIAEPLTLLQCCPTTDGAAAVVLAGGKAAERLANPRVRVAASVITSGRYTNQAKGELGPDEDLATRAGAAAYEMAGLGPSEIDVAEVHDAFTIGEILAYENLGLCERGEGGRLVSDGVTALGRPAAGQHQRRPSLAWPSARRNRGRAGGRAHAPAPGSFRATPGPRGEAALAHVMGGSTPGIGTAASAVHVLTT